MSLEKKKKLIDLKNEISFIKKNFKNIKSKRILDMGSGFGFFLSSFDKSWDKIGIEISDLASENSKKWSKIYNIDLQKKIDNKSKKILGKFDAVFSYHVIEHLKNPEQFIKNAYLLMKQNAFFVIGTPNFDSGAARYFKKKYRFYHDETHISYFSENSLFRLLEDNGFKILKVDYPYFDTAHFNIKNLKKMFNKKSISPPFYGNIMTFYCKKRNKRELINYLKYKEKKIKFNLNNL